MHAVRKELTIPLAGLTLGVMLLGLPTPTRAQQTLLRPIGDFVAAQGTFPGPLFVPPVKNFLGWIDPKTNQSISADYAGLADAWITDASSGAKSFNTQTEGVVTEHPLPDGRALVRVLLHTRNALTWAVDGSDFAKDPLIFGHRAPDVLAGKNPALGECFLEAIYIAQKPGAPMPDLMQLAFSPRSGEEFVRIAFYARAKGELRPAFNVPDGTPGRISTTQVGLFMTGFKGAVADGFPAEHIKIQRTGK